MALAAPGLRRALLPRDRAGGRPIASEPRLRAQCDARAPPAAIARPLCAVALGPAGGARPRTKPDGRRAPGLRLAMDTTARRALLRRLHHRMGRSSRASRSTPRRGDALAALREIVDAPEQWVEFRIEQGQLQYLNNRQIAHSRTAFRDAGEPGQIRSHAEVVEPRGRHDSRRRAASRLTGALDGPRDGCLLGRRRLRRLPRPRGRRLRLRPDRGAAC